MSKTIFLKTSIPLAGDFLSKSEVGNDQTYPFSLSFDSETKLVRVEEEIDPKILFGKYFYKTGSIKTLVSHLKNTSNFIKRNFKHSKICELGCNDFSFLKNFKNELDFLLGIDPSDVSREYRVDGVELINDFFNFEKSLEIKKNFGEFDVVFSSNNFAHINNIKDYTKGISNLIGDDGKFIFEVHWLKPLIENFQIGFLYHEHIYYYSVKSLQILLVEFGLYINSVSKMDIHGGSIRVVSSKSNKKDSSVGDFLEEEEAAGLYNLDTFTGVSSKIQKMKAKTEDFFKKIKKDGKVVYGYGASGQANSLMSFLGIKKDDLSFMIDDSPLKDGKFTPRTHIEIRNSKFLLENPPDVIYVTAYTFLEEIKQKNNWFKGEWIHPLEI